MHVVQTFNIPNYSGSPLAGVVATPIETEGKIWVNGGDGVLHVLNSTSGTEVAAIDLESDFAVGATPTAAGGVVYATRGSYVPSSDTKLFAIDAKTFRC